MNLDWRWLLELLNLDRVLWTSNADWVTSKYANRAIATINQWEYKVEINRELQWITLKNIDWDTIGVIYRWSYKRWCVKTDVHLYKKINKEFRGKGYWSILIQEYLNSWFLLPIVEFTKDFWVYRLLKKFWYKLKSIINPKTWYEEKFNDDLTITDSQLQDVLNAWYILKLQVNDK